MREDGRLGIDRPVSRIGDVLDVGGRDPGGGDQRERPGEQRAADGSRALLRFAGRNTAPTDAVSTDRRARLEAETKWGSAPRPSRITLVARADGSSGPHGRWNYDSSRRTSDR